MSLRSRSTSRYIPVAIGAVAVAISAYYLARKRGSLIGPEVVLKGDGQWVDIPLYKIEKESHDVDRLIFKLPKEDAVLGLPLCGAVFAKYVTEKGNNVVRPYTPISDIHAKGFFELCIKKYPGGKMSGRMHSLKPGDTMTFKGPIKKWQWEPNSFEEITLLAAGTGTTPLYQLASHIAKNPKDTTKVNIFYGNKTPGDILLKKEWKELEEKYPDQINVQCFVDEVRDAEKDNFKGHIGFITKEFIEKMHQALIKTRIFSFVDHQDL
ncbi:cytochrome b5 reductase family protein NDAI_0C03840 [Naumovozyma dairenensis CBS 421]|uniref:cytochrome-b5 reductase n=1 Tax=Naumovozyma dairenensis (strain ATCC 10597 / BCRC 20456 / CBS 421 / NBRC 0211 / NRRL Y-12639) TaxID=1071378 RepID=G0W8D3_NAUDC|nr:hypothetical protein NDAI_0C03840 [Naumovozyma dairenensis CBS 421]CCD24044.1 hypothetical protein NDAI_0C03840 [Naumovozyma dairenensis CBS 421]